jgi:hypothetical protein
MKIVKSKHNTRLDGGGDDDDDDDDDDWLESQFSNILTYRQTDYKNIPASSSFMCLHSLKNNVKSQELNYN